MKHIIAIENESQWLDLRKDYVGASELSALFGPEGGNPYDTPFSLYMDKTGQYAGKFESPLMEFGKDMEPLIAKWVAKETGWEIMKGNEYHIHPTARAGATLDYYILQSARGPGLLEIKNVNGFADGWDKEVAPFHVEMQLQAQLWIINAARVAEGQSPFTWGAIGSMHGGNPEDVRVFERDIDVKVQAVMNERTAKFWAAVDTKTAPEIEGAKDYEMVKDLFKAANTKEVLTVLDLSGEADIDQLIARYDHHLGVVKESQQQADDIETVLLRKMLAVGADGVKRSSSAETQKHRLYAKVAVVNYNPQPAKAARIGSRFTFNIKSK